MRVYILIDPPQDYEESGTILGVFGTHAEAVAAEAANRNAAEKVGLENREEWFYHEASRIMLIELWEGATRLKAWVTTWPKLVDGKVEYKWEVSE